MTDHNFVCSKKEGRWKRFCATQIGADMAGLMAEAFWSLGKKVFFIETF